MLPVWGKWIVLAVVCMIAEIFTPSFYVFWFGVGALFAALLAGLGVHIYWQFAGFLVSTAILVFFTKSITFKLFNKREQTKTNVYGIVGKSGYVTGTIPKGSQGQVRIENEIWSARSATGASIQVGTAVEVLDVKGVHLLVEPLAKSRGLDCNDSV